MKGLLQIIIVEIDMQNWERSGLFEMRKPDHQAENRRSRGGTEGTQFSIQDGLHSILSLSSYAHDP